TCLPVANDQFPLSPADGHKGVNGLQSRLQRLMHRLPVHHAGGDIFHRAEAIGFDGAFAVDGLTHGVYYPADQRLSYRYFHDPACSFDFVSFTDMSIRT